MNCIECKRPFTPEHVAQDACSEGCVRSYVIRQSERLARGRARARKAEERAVRQARRAGSKQRRFEVGCGLYDRDGEVIG